MKNLKIILLCFATVFLSELTTKSYQSEIKTNEIDEKINNSAFNGDNITITCSFSLKDTNYNKNDPNKHKPYEIDISWIYPNYNFTLINQSYINEEKIFLNNSIHSILSIKPATFPSDKGYYICILYIDRTLTAQKGIYINLEDLHLDENVERNDSPPLSTTFISVTVVIILIFLSAIVYVLWLTFRRKPPVHNRTNGNHNIDRTVSINSAFELTEYPN